MENYFAYQYKCCEHCSNNPANNPHATGICFCALPAMERGGTTRTDTRTNRIITSNRSTFVSDFMKGKRNE